MRGNVSAGCALWIGFYLTDWFRICKWDKASIQEIFFNQNVRKFVTDMHEAKMPLHYCWQEPGQSVESPAGVGAGHIVLTVARYAEQYAFNSAFTAEGIRNCLRFYAEVPTPGISSACNSAVCVILTSGCVSALQFGAGNANHCTVFTFAGDGLSARPRNGAQGSSDVRTCIDQATNFGTFSCFATAPATC